MELAFSVPDKVSGLCHEISIPNFVRLNKPCYASRGIFELTFDFTKIFVSKVQLLHNKSNLNRIMTNNSE